MNALDVLGDRHRRRVLELLAGGERPAGDVVRVLADEFGISQPATSQHLRVLREQGLVRVRAEGTRRLYALEVDALREVDRWLTQFRSLWEPQLDALGTEIARGKKARRRASPRTTDTTNRRIG